MGIEDGGEEQYQQYTKDDECECLVVAVIEHQQHEAKHYRRAYPNNLHTRSGAKAKDVRVVKGIAGTADAGPTTNEQEKV
jgi:hypothetical protein